MSARPRRRHVLASILGLTALLSSVLPTAAVEPTDLTATPLSPRAASPASSRLLRNSPSRIGSSSAGTTPPWSMSSSSSTTTRLRTIRRRHGGFRRDQPLRHRQELSGNRSPQFAMRLSSRPRKTPFVSPRQRPARQGRHPCASSTAASRLHARERGRDRPRDPRRRRGPVRQAAAAAHRLEPGIHRRDRALRRARRHGQCRRRASSSASSTPASGRSTRRSPTRATCAPPPRPTARRGVQLRRQPADAGDGRVRLQQQADRRRARSSTPYLSSPTARGGPVPARPATATATARHTASHGGRQRRSTRRRCSASIADRSTASRPAPGSSDYKVCGAEGCFDSDSAAAVAAGHPRRRRRDQLLDLRRHRAVHRPGRAGLPRRLRGRRLRGGLGRQRRPRRGHRQPPLAVGHHGRRVDPDPRVRVDPHPHRPATRTRSASTAPRSPPAPARCRSSWRSACAVQQRRCAHPAGRRQARSTGKIVACQRGGNARVEKGFNVIQGGAAGMVLYNPTLADVETDNHWLPTVHLADGTEFQAFMARHHRRAPAPSPPARSATGRAT